jgi:hypothetical protein
MVYTIVTILLQMLAAIAAAAVLGFGYVFLIFLGDAHAHGKHLLSRKVDWLAALIVYLSWFGLMLRFGYSQLLLMVGCGAAALLAAIYVASYRTAERQAKQQPPDLAAA